MAKSPIDPNHRPVSPRARRQIRHSTLYRYLIADTMSEELDSWRLFFRREWHWLLLALTGIVVLTFWVKPLPPSEVALAVGPKDSALARLGERYVEPFAQAGITLRLVYTDSVNPTEQELSNDIDAAFLVGGTFDESNVSDMVSLGSVEYAPLWVFHRGEVQAGIDFFDAFANRNLKIGLAGPISRAIIGRMGQLRGMELTSAAGFEPSPDFRVVDQFLQGVLDVVVIVDGYDSGYISQLINASNTSLFNMFYAQAYQRQIPFLEVVSVPQGALSLATLRPTADVTLISSTVSLLVKQSLHPTAQQLFLTATEEVDGLTEPFFARPGFFPDYLDPAVPLSSVAKRYYAEDGLALSNRLPYWLASLIDRLWLLVLGLFAVLYPTFKLIPRYRVLRSKIQISDGYQVLRAIDMESGRAQTSSELIELRADLNLLEDHLRQFWISSESMRWYFSLRDMVTKLRAQLDSRIAELKKTEQAGS